MKMILSLAMLMGIFVNPALAQTSERCIIVSNVAFVVAGYRDKGAPIEQIKAILSSGVVSVDVPNDPVTMQLVDDAVDAIYEQPSISPQTFAELSVMACTQSGY